MTWDDPECDENHKLSLFLLVQVGSAAPPHAHAHAHKPHTVCFGTLAGQFDIVCISTFLVGVRAAGPNYEESCGLWSIVIFIHVRSLFFLPLRHLHVPLSVDLCWPSLFLLYPLLPLTFYLLADAGDWPHCTLLLFCLRSLTLVGLLLEMCGCGEQAIAMKVCRNNRERSGEREEEERVGGERSERRREVSLSQEEKRRVFVRSGLSSSHLFFCLLNVSRKRTWWRWCTWYVDTCTLLCVATVAVSLNLSLRSWSSTKAHQCTDCTTLVHQNFRDSKGTRDVHNKLLQSEPVVSPGQLFIFFMWLFGSCFAKFIYLIKF